MPRVYGTVCPSIAEAGRGVQWTAPRVLYLLEETPSQSQAYLSLPKKLTSCNTMREQKRQTFVITCWACVAFDGEFKSWPILRRRTIEDKRFDGEFKLHRIHGCQYSQFSSQFQLLNTHMQGPGMCL